MQAADGRTSLLFAANVPAELSVSAGDGCTVYYTTDGSDPATGNTAKTIENTQLKITPTGNTDISVVLKLVAEKNGFFSSVTTVPIQFVSIPPAQGGTAIYEGSASCSTPSGSPYTVRLRVITINGLIQRIEDDQTVFTDETGSDEAFWRGFDVISEMNDRMNGKSLDALLSMKTAISRLDGDGLAADAVSGATVSSNSIKYATVDALRRTPVSTSEAVVLAPQLLADKTVATNTESETLEIKINTDEKSGLHYTTDGTEPTLESAVVGTLSFSGEKGLQFTADPTKHPNGECIDVRVAAFDAEGNRSDIVRQPLVFAMPRVDSSYQTGQYEATTGGVTATVHIEDPRYTGSSFITVVAFDQQTSRTYAEVLPDWLAQLYQLQMPDESLQMTNGVDCSVLLESVTAAISKAEKAAAPTLTISPEMTTYANDAEVNVTLQAGSATDRIFYTVDSSVNSGLLSDPTKTGVAYSTPFAVSIDDVEGGTLYIRAAAQNEAGTWSSIVRKDLSFAKGVSADAFTVNGVGYGSWPEAVAAINQMENGGTILLSDNVQLSSTDALPTKPCIIMSSTATDNYQISGGVLTAQADLKFDRVNYAITRIYANGHNVEIGSNVKTGFSFTGFSLFAGGNQQDVEADVNLQVNAGTFAVLGSGNGGTTLTGDVEISVGGTASVTLAGVYMNAAVDGNVSCIVDGNGGQVTLSEFLGEQNGGTIDGELLLKIKDAPKLKSWGTLLYKASVNRADSFGLLDLTDCTLEDTSMFSGFKTNPVP